MDKRDRLRPGEIRAIIVDGVEKYAVLGHHMPVESLEVAQELVMGLRKRCGGNSLRGCGRDRDISEFNRAGKGHRPYCKECDDRYRWGVRPKLRVITGSICDWCGEFVKREEIRPDSGPQHACDECLSGCSSLNFPHWPGRWYKGENPNEVEEEEEEIRSYGPMPDFGRSSW